jgi:hypothetical protein
MRNTPGRPVENIPTPLCKITDERALRRMTTKAVRDYLLEHGWTEVVPNSAKDPKIACAFRVPTERCEPIPPGTPDVLVVPPDLAAPASSFHPSGPEAGSAILAALATLEQRSEMDVWRDLVGACDFGELLQELVDGVLADQALHCVHRGCGAVATRLHQHRETGIRWLACEAHPPPPEAGPFRAFRTGFSAPLKRALAACDDE